MLYTSLSEPFGAALIWAYGAEAQVVAVGSTALSGDAALDAKYPPLTWEKFARPARRPSLLNDRWHLQPRGLRPSGVHAEAEDDGLGLSRS